MRFGLSDAFLPEDMTAVDRATAARVRELGFSGVFTRFTDHDPFALSRDDCEKVRAAFAGERVEMFQATGYRPALVHPDEDARKEATRTLCRALEIASWLGARTVDTGPGSMSPRGPWCPDPYNFTVRALEQLVKSVREAARAAEWHGVVLCLEGHQLVTLRSAQVMREVVDAVDSEWVKVDFDPVNWISLETVYTSGEAIADMLSVLRGHVASAHIKDIVLRDDMVVHLDHCPPGQGMLDSGALLRGMEAIDPMAPVIVEATPTEEVPAVADYLFRLAAENGIEVRS